MRLGEFAGLRVAFRGDAVARVHPHALSSQALVIGCPFLTSMSLLGAPHLSNAALMAIAKNTNLNTFGLEGEVFPPQESSKRTVKDRMNLSH